MTISRFFTIKIDVSRTTISNRQMIGQLVPTISRFSIVKTNLPTISRFFIVKTDLSRMTTHADLVLAKQNIILTRPRSSKKYND